MIAWLLSLAVLAGWVLLSRSHVRYYRRRWREAVKVIEAIDAERAELENRCRELEGGTAAVAARRRRVEGYRARQ